MGRARWNVNVKTTDRHPHVGTGASYGTQGSTQVVNDALPSQVSQKIPLQAQSSSVVQRWHAGVKDVEQMPLPA